MGLTRQPASSTFGNPVKLVQTSGLTKIGYSNLSSWAGRTKHENTLTDPIFTAHKPNIGTYWKHVKFQHIPTWYPVRLPDVPALAMIFPSCIKTYSLKPTKKHSGTLAETDLLAIARQSVRQNGAYVRKQSLVSTVPTSFCH